MEKTLVIKGCSGCLISGVSGSRLPWLILAWFARLFWHFVDPTYVGGHLRAISHSNGRSPHTHLRVITRVQWQGGWDIFIKSWGKHSVLEVLLAFRWGESLHCFVYLSVPRLTPREKLSSAQEALSTQKDDYTTQDYLCLPLTLPSMLSPRGLGSAKALREPKYAITP